MQTPTQYPVINWNNAARKCNYSDIEFLNLSCTPHEETCTPAGQDQDQQISECTALINQLIREQGPAPEGAEYFIIENTGHDFGIYYETGIFYRQTDEEAEEETPAEIYALKMEGSIPEQWDEEAKEELRKAGHPAHQPAKVVKMKAA